MSVTLKIADEDAAVIASILKAVAEESPKTTADQLVPDYSSWIHRLRMSHSGRTPDMLRELAGAFAVAVKANRK